MKTIGLVLATTLFGSSLLTQTALADDLSANLTLAVAQTAASASWVTEQQHAERQRAELNASLEDAMTEMNQKLNQKLEQQIAEMMERQLAH